jgi:pyruvate kinase
MPLNGPDRILEQMLVLREMIYKEGLERFRGWYPTISRLSFLPGALNLSFYLALRHHDLRPLQRALKPLGLSTLGRSEAGAIANLDAVIATLACLAGRQGETPIPHPRADHFYKGEWNLDRQTKLLFGPCPPVRRARIMVTLDATCASEMDPIKSLLAAGMDVARINCAHDDREIWAAMIANVRRAERELGRPCRVLMELAGAKNRISRVIAAGDAAKVADSRILLTRDASSPTELIPARQPATRLECTCPGSLAFLRIGDPVHLDDGKINGVVEAVEAGQALVRVVATAKRKPVKLKPGKGLNLPGHCFPDTPAITAKDRRDLDFIVTAADLVGLSWIKTADDVTALQTELGLRMGDEIRRLPMVAKIETAGAVNHLPEIIVRAASRQPLALMIARGDLALEVGYERLAELQEEVLWLSEAAHVPVIWATQVLENLVKYGAPSRAEITDAAMSERAECVMLNKGPYIVEGVNLLDKVLARMDGHQRKKTARFGVVEFAVEENPAAYGLPVCEK